MFGIIGLTQCDLHITQQIKKQLTTFGQKHQFWITNYFQQLYKKIPTSLKKLKKYIKIAITLTKTITKSIILITLELQ